MEQMKTIGLIGGMSWESSKIYYDYINTMVKQRLGGSHSAKNIMISVNFSEIEKLTFQGHWNKIGAIMAMHSKKLQTAGADMILLCTNTIHLVSGAIENTVHIPFLHIADAVGEKITSKGLKKVGLLGTKFTMEREFYTQKLMGTYELEVIVPFAAERQLVHDIIYNELVHGVFTEDSKKICVALIKKLEKRGAEGIILGCTELPLLVADKDVDIPVFDTTKIHAQKAVDLALM